MNGCFQKTYFVMHPSVTEKEQTGHELLLQSHGTALSLFALRADSRWRLIKGQPGCQPFRAGSFSHCCWRRNAITIWCDLIGGLQKRQQGMEMNDVGQCKNNFESSLTKETPHFAPITGSTRTCGHRREQMPCTKCQLAAGTALAQEA